MTTSRLRALPAVEKLLRHDALVAALARVPRPLVLEAVRATLADARAALRRGRGAAAPDADALARVAAARAEAAARPQLVRVLNATGIVLHTNLGRAPLAAAAQRAVAEVAAGYSSLEYDLAAGRRGDRGLGIERWLVRLTGAEAACVVNNGAAAILLALAALARGRKVIVSRGELVEIGGSFRVPEILEASGATLVEVGTTNRTHLRDYERALERHGHEVGVLLRVHPSNFRIEGFTARPALAELAALAHRARVPLVEDLGSGALVDFAALGLEHEPTVAESLAAGTDVVTCSGDKLLGGAQAGLVLGRRASLARIRRDPLARVARADKLALAALEATLALLAEPERARTGLPVLAMLGAGDATLRARAERLAAALAAHAPALRTRVVATTGEVGGGALPRQKLRGWGVDVRHDTLSAAALEARARAAEPPIVAIVRAGALRFDVRTLADEDVDVLAKALRGALA